MPLIQYPQDRADAALARLIAALQSTAWPADGAEQPFPTAPDTHATSFVLLEGGEAVCHVGVRRCAFAHKGQTYLAYGLSEVVTHPRFQNRGIASGVIREARPQPLYLRAGEGLLLHAGRLDRRRGRPPCGRHKAGAFPQRQPAPDNHADADFGKGEAPCGRF